MKYESPKSPGPTEQMSKLGCFSVYLQIELIGQSIYEFAHPCDHDEVKDVLEKIDPEKPDMEEEFFIRLKCTLTSKGKNINLKSATYKVRVL